MKLTIVRHGETIENKNKTVQGQLPGQLTKLGIKQAQLVSERLKNHVFDKVYASDLQRVKDTTKEIVKHHPGIEVIYDKRLREWGRGIYEGGPRENFKQAIIDSGLDFLDFKPEGGESIKETHSRVNEFLEYLKKKENGKKILLVTHGGVITLSHLTFLNEGYERRHEYNSPNTAVSEVEYLGNDKFKVTLSNCAKHLNEEDKT